MSELFIQSLTLMGKGMVGIFAVILIIFVVLLFLGKKPKERGKKGESKEQGDSDPS